MHNPITHKQLADALKVSRPYVTKLVSLGMPTDSIQSAKRWLAQQRKASSSGKHAPLNLNAVRIENILLRNQLLRLEMAQAEDTTELIAVSRLQDAVHHFLVWARISGRNSTERSAENLASAAKPEAAFEIASAMMDEALHHGLIAMLAASKLRDDDPRLFSLVSAAVKSSKGFTDEQIDGFVSRFVEGIKQSVP